MWGCVGKCVFSGLRERIRGRQESGKTLAGAREYTENHDITGDGQKYRKYGKILAKHHSDVGYYD